MKRTSVLGGYQNTWRTLLGRFLVRASWARHEAEVVDSFTRLVTLEPDLEEQNQACRSVVPRLGVKGSQVRILSSRRLRQSPLIWIFLQVGGLFCVLMWILL